MKCKECGKEPFGVESWHIPRGEGVKRVVLCPDCYLLAKLDIGLQQVKDGKGLTTAEVKKRLRDKFADDTKGLFDESDY